MLKALNNAYPEWMLLSDLHSAAGYKPAQFAGLMGAFGRRMSHTDGYDRDAHFFEYRWNNDEDAWEYRLPESVREVLNPLQRSDMKALSPSKLKNHALTPGPTQYLAFDELARRIRENPSSWNPGTGPWFWDRLDCTPAPSAVAAEWAYLGWSQQLNDGQNSELEQELEARLEELERHLEQDPDSYESSRKYHDAIGREVRSAAGLT